ncbi:Vacuolar iron transporter [Rhynchospora pubera]|uniref:Vacuolar iron transporter n=1 Tax=Rhynchospora pubera TaxID=906938 RepID=A0AAV8GDK9_9POAL|nr:Vacuolar iron transporter [Rhynchospora pubera]
MYCLPSIIHQKATSPIFLQRVLNTLLFTISHFLKEKSMSFSMSTSQVHASNSPPPNPQSQQIQTQESQNPEEIDYSGRAQWLRAAVLGANDGLVSVASLMIGVGAVNRSSRAMIVSGLAGLVAGACSMAIGEFVSVYTQYDIELAQMKREKEDKEAGLTKEEKENLPSPIQAAGASALAFASGALLPLLAGAFIHSWEIRLAVVCVVTTLALAGFGAAGAILGGANAKKSAVRVLLGGWVAMAISYGVLRLFALTLHESSSL